MFNKIKKYSIVTAGAFCLIVSSAQATTILMSSSSLCSIGDGSYNSEGVWDLEETGAEIVLGTMLYGSTVRPVYLASSAWILNPTEPTIYGFDGKLAGHQGSSFYTANVVIESTSTDPKQSLLAYSRISGPGVSYIKFSTVKFGNLPAVRQWKIASCKDASDYQFI